ncbi:MAG: AAA family ATPase [Tissierellia bacterium]|nr:AAA family ATPase [Tissierellia bacterium]
MKPINLKIKGLNSFIETQEVNFERLTEKGLFGIFGPTGSGKSTILDGITLALYGEISRKSTNYMNTNCDSMFVSYEFQMTDKEIRRYRVEREFRRDKKTGNVRTKSAIIVDVTDGEEVLEDKVRSVTEKCEEIIGLKVDDFTRTVVLPQGKFSEFLKLEGRERREMLERLFNLQKYGDELSFKLGAKIKEENQKLNVLLGELKTYENVSDELQKKMKNDLYEIKKEEKKCQHDLEAAEKSYMENKDLWLVQKELAEAKSKEETLKEKEAEINIDRERVAIGESALKVKPYLDSYENTLKEITGVKSEIDQLNSIAKKIHDNKKQLEIDFKQAKERKDIELPKLKIKEQDIIEAIEEKNALSKLVEEKDNLNKDILKAEEEELTIRKNIEINQKNIISLNEEITFNEEKVESLRISEDFKNKVNDGFILLKECESITKQQVKLKNDLENTSKNITELTKISERLSKVLNEKENQLSKVSNQLDTLMENSPGDQDTLLTLNKHLLYITDRWDKYKEYSHLIEKSKENSENLRKKLKIREDIKEKLNKDIINLKDKIKKYQIENTAQTLRENLKDGHPCPVCGSLEHSTENISIETSDSLQELKEEQEDLELKLNSINEEIIKIMERLKAEEDTIRSNKLKLKDLGNDYKEYDVKELKKEFNEKYKIINQYNEEKTTLDKSIKDLTEEKNKILIQYNKINSKLEHNRNQLKKLQLEEEVKAKEVKEVEYKLSLIKKEIHLEDFLKARQDINKKEKERTILENNIKKLRDRLKKEEVSKESLSNEYNNLKIQLQEKKTLLGEIVKSIENKEKFIINKAGSIDNLNLIKEKITESINNIESKFLEAEKKKEEIEEKFNNINNKIISYQGNLVSLQERIIKDKEVLDKMLAEEGISTAEEVKNNYISKLEIEKIKRKIESYNNSLAQIKGEIISLNKKINNRRLTEDQWNEIQKKKKDKEEKLQDLQKTVAGMEVQLKSIEDKLSVKKELLKEKDSLDYKMALLNDLDKLFRGKRFVEFVAANQLKYVSLEASRRLKEITGGTYGLEVDEDGKFLIRDYKNGGAQRDASTLSGGETFVASLALALSLSSQIQLKGTSPLELFFLDEGFGTLDDDLLDLVMDSLERVYHKRLSVGIISHVESIKNRVPVKLIVKPAQSGLGGSKVKIEVS